MQSIQQTLRKSKEISERYKRFLEEKAIHDQSMKETDKKIENTQQKLKQTQATVKSIQDMYSKYEDMMDKVFDAAVENLKTNGGWIASDQNFKPWMISEKQFVNILKEKQKIVFITGAGISAASGIPTFRGQGGFWNNNNDKDIDPQQILTNHFYKQNPFETWKWLQDFYLLKSKSKPNKGHISLAQIVNYLLEKGKEVSIITQNIDNFHIQAQREVSSKAKIKLNKKCTTYEIHGNINFVRCQKCSSKQNKLICYPYEKYRPLLSKQEISYCSECSQSLRPHVMFFDQFYSEHIHHSQSAKKIAQEADLMVIIGTTLSTGLVSNLVSHAINNDNNGKKIIVEINSQCQIRKNKVRKIQQKSEQVLVNIKNLLIK